MEDMIDGGYDIIADFCTREIQHELMTAKGYRIVRRTQYPIRMCMVKLGIDGDHLWFKPKAKFQPSLMCTLCNSGKTALQFFPIDEDIAKRGIIVVSLAEPAVIQHHEFKSKISRTGGKPIHLFFVKIKIGRFPIIDENRPHGIAIFPAHNVMAHRLMKCLTHAI